MKNNIQKRNIRFKKINEDEVYSSYYWSNREKPVLTDEEIYDIVLLALKIMFLNVEFNYKGKVLYGDDLLKKYKLSVSDILNLDFYGDPYDYNMSYYDLRYEEDEDYWSLLEDVYILYAGEKWVEEHANEIDIDNYEDVKYFTDIESLIGEGIIEVEIISKNDKQITKDLLKIL